MPPKKKKTSYEQRKRIYELTNQLKGLVDRMKGAHAGKLRSLWPKAVSLYESIYPHLDSANTHDGFITPRYTISAINHFFEAINEEGPKLHYPDFEAISKDDPLIRASGWYNANWFEKQGRVTPDPYEDVVQDDEADGPNYITPTPTPTPAPMPPPSPSTSTASYSLRRRTISATPEGGPKKLRGRKPNPTPWDVIVIADSDVDQTPAPEAAVAVAESVSAPVGGKKKGKGKTKRGKRGGKAVMEKEKEATASEQWTTLPDSSASTPVAGTRKRKAVKAEMYMPNEKGELELVASSDEEEGASKSRPKSAKTKQTAKAKDKGKGKAKDTTTAKRTKPKTRFALPEDEDDEEEEEEEEEEIDQLASASSSSSRTSSPNPVNAAPPREPSIVELGWNHPNATDDIVLVEDIPTRSTKAKGKGKPRKKGRISTNPEEVITIYEEAVLNVPRDYDASNPIDVDADAEVAGSNTNMVIDNLPEKATEEEESSSRQSDERNGSAASGDKEVAGTTPENGAATANSGITGVGEDIASKVNGVSRDAAVVVHREDEQDEQEVHVSPTNDTLPEARDVEMEPEDKAASPALQTPPGEEAQEDSVSQVLAGDGDILMGDESVQNEAAAVEYVQVAQAGGLASLELRDSADASVPESTLAPRNPSSEGTESAEPETGAPSIPAEAQNGNSEVPPGDVLMGDESVSKEAKEANDATAVVHALEYVQTAQCGGVVSLERGDSIASVPESTLAPQNPSREGAQAETETSVPAQAQEMRDLTPNLASAGDGDAGSAVDGVPRNGELPSMDVDVDHSLAKESSPRLVENVVTSLTDNELPQPPESDPPKSHSPDKEETTENFVSTTDDLPQVHAAGSDLSTPDKSSQDRDLHCNEMQLSADEKTAVVVEQKLDTNEIVVDAPDGKGSNTSMVIDNLPKKALEEEESSFRQSGDALELDRNGSAASGNEMVADTSSGNGGATANSGLTGVGEGVASKANGATNGNPGDLSVGHSKVGNSDILDLHASRGQSSNLPPTGNNDTLSTSSSGKNTISPPKATSFFVRNKTLIAPKETAPATMSQDNRFSAPSSSTDYSYMSVEPYYKYDSPRSMGVQCARCIEEKAICVNVTGVGPCDRCTWHEYQCSFVAPKGAVSHDPGSLKRRLEDLTGVPAPSLSNKRVKNDDSDLVSVVASGGMPHSNAMAVFASVLQAPANQVTLSSSRSNLSLAPTPAPIPQVSIPNTAQNGSSHPAHYSRRNSSVDSTSTPPISQVTAYTTAPNDSSQAAAEPDPQRHYRSTMQRDAAQYPAPAPARTYHSNPQLATQNPQVAAPTSTIPSSSTTQQAAAPVDPEPVARNSGRVKQHARKSTGSRPYGYTHGWSRQVLPLRSAPSPPTASSSGNTGGSSSTVMSPHPHRAQDPAPAPARTYYRNPQPATQAPDLKPETVIWSLNERPPGSEGTYRPLSPNVASTTTTTQEAAQASTANPEPVMRSLSDTPSARQSGGIKRQARKSSSSGHTESTVMPPHPVPSTSSSSKLQQAAAPVDPDPVARNSGRVKQLARMSTDSRYTHEWKPQVLAHGSEPSPSPTSTASRKSEGNGANVTATETPVVSPYPAGQPHPMSVHPVASSSRDPGNSRTAHAAVPPFPTQPHPVSNNGGATTESPPAPPYPVAQAQPVPPYPAVPGQVPVVSLYGLPVIQYAPTSTAGATGPNETSYGEPHSVLPHQATVVSQYSSLTSAVHYPPPSSAGSASPNKPNGSPHPVVPQYQPQVAPYPLSSATTSDGAAPTVTHSGHPDTPHARYSSPMAARPNGTGGIPTYDTGANSRNGSNASVQASFARASPQALNHSIQSQAGSSRTSSAGPRASLPPVLPVQGELTKAPSSTGGAKSENSAVDSADIKDRYTPRQSPSPFTQPVTPQVSLDNKEVASPIRSSREASQRHRSMLASPSPTRHSRSSSTSRQVSRPPTLPPLAEVPVMMDIDNDTAPPLPPVPALSSNVIAGVTQQLSDLRAEFSSYKSQNHDDITALNHRVDKMQSSLEGLASTLAVILDKIGSIATPPAPPPVVVREVEVQADGWLEGEEDGEIKEVAVATAVPVPMRVDASMQTDPRPKRPLISILQAFTANGQIAIDDDDDSDIDIDFQYPE